MTAPTITREQLVKATTEGAASALDDVCPHTGILARAWRDGRRKMVAERLAVMADGVGDGM